MTRHFLSLTDLTSQELLAIIDRASQLRQMHRNKELHQPFTGKVLGMIFEKSSTRTRVSFEAGMNQLGGSAIFLSSHDSQLGRGESVEDTARVLSRMVDIVMIRTFNHSMVERFAAVSDVPVINALTDAEHPCQLLADMQTFTEHSGSIAGKTVAWIGDGNNMCHSYITAAARFGFHLNIATPKGFEPNPQLLAQHAAWVTCSHDPLQAAKNADLITTDVWASMGQEAEQTRRAQLFADFQVNQKIMELAHPKALFLHCLPAHRGEEVSAQVIDGAQSCVWDQAENRLHAQKALIEFLLNTSNS